MHDVQLLYTVTLKKSQSTLSYKHSWPQIQNVCLPLSQWPMVHLAVV